MDYGFIAPCSPRDGAIQCWKLNSLFRLARPSGIMMFARRYRPRGETRGYIQLSLTGYVELSITLMTCSNDRYRSLLIPEHGIY